MIHTDGRPTIANCGPLEPIVNRDPGDENDSPARVDCPTTGQKCPGGCRGCRAPETAPDVAGRDLR